MIFFSIVLLIRIPIEATNSFTLPPNLHARHQSLPYPPAWHTSAASAALTPALSKRRSILRHPLSPSSFSAFCRRRLFPERPLQAFLQYLIRAIRNM